MTEKTKAEKTVPVNIPITPEEKRKVFILAAANGWALRDQVALFVREGIERQMPAGRLVVK